MSQSGVRVELRDFAFQNRLQTFSIVNLNHQDLHEFFRASVEHFELRINELLDVHYLLKVCVSFVGNFEKTFIDDEGGRAVESQKIYLNTRTEIIDFETDLRTFFREYIVNIVDQKIEDIELRGSGFALAEIVELNVQVSSYDPCAGSTYIPLPKYLQDKHAIINVKNNDNQCFKYAILSALYPQGRNSERVSNYLPYNSKVNFTDIRFPVELKDIAKFESKNPTISINVYMFESKNNKIRTLRLTKNVKKNHIHLLLLTESGDDSRKSHYCWIKKLSALLNDQITKNTRKKYFCDRCLNHFVSVEKLDQHSVACINQNDYQIEMPSFRDNIMEFHNSKNQLKVNFIIYADVESILKKPDVQFSATDTTVAYQQHEVFSIGYYFKCMYDDSQSFYRSRRGSDCVEWFVNELATVVKKVDWVINNPKPLKMSMEDEVLFFMADKCHICGGEFGVDDVKVRDHSHITGEFRDAAHQKCNLNYQEARHVPVIFHNLSNYDAHFIIRDISNKIPGQISIIPCNDQQYISFTKVIPSIYTSEYNHFIKLRFIDSFRFMASSLDYLSSLLPFHEKKILQSQCREMTSEQMQLLQRKGVFCYDYVDSYSKLDETSLPSKTDFYNRLTQSHVTDEDYDFAKKVWQTFNIKTIGEYSDLYMKTDILLLADVFENFREICFHIYKLDPAHYYTAPGLSFDAMLKYTRIRIELFTDIDMLLFVERGIRGGISQCSKRYAKANNKYMEQYDSKSESTYLMYLDANNLYGFSMMQFLPIDGYQWCSDEDFTTERILNISDESPVGYIFEVDLDYPQHLHDLHKDYPFCPENRHVPHTRNEQKLLLTLFNKRNYVIHYRMLKCVLQQGLVLKRVHKVLKFNQSPWLKPYIELNTALRTMALSKFEKDFYKLLINAIYGKTMENMRSRVDIQLRTTWDGRYGIRKMVSKPHFKRYQIFDENLAAIELNQIRIRMNKPIIVGMAILDSSKVLMYDFYYGHIKPNYGQNVEMLYTDTDSFILQVKTDCFYTDMKQNLNRYDTSDYSENNMFNMPLVNKKIPGLFKDEMNGEIMTEFVGLRSKMYCVRCGKKEEKKAKGVKKCVLKKSITFKHYMKCIKQNVTIRGVQNTIRSKNHNVFTIRQEKILLSPADNKRYILLDNIETLPWGHYKIPN